MLAVREDTELIFLRHGYSQDFANDVNRLAIDICVLNDDGSVFSCLMRQSRRLGRPTRFLSFEVNVKRAFVDRITEGFHGRGHAWAMVRKSVEKIRLVWPIDVEILNQR